MRQEFPELHTERDVLALFTTALWLRARTPADSTEIARRTFDATNPQRLPFSLDPRLEKIREEFGALEAPGSPEDPTMDLVEFDDQLWNNLAHQVAAYPRSA